MTVHLHTTPDAVSFYIILKQIVHIQRISNLHYAPEAQKKEVLVLRRCVRISWRVYPSPESVAVSDRKEKTRVPAIITERKGSDGSVRVFLQPLWATPERY